MLQITQDELLACLAATPPVELLGMTLLKQGSPQPPLTSTSRDTLVQAVTEMVSYIDRCMTAAQRLSNLTPVPLRNVQIVEFGL